MRARKHKATTSATRTIAYVRVSTEDQAREGVSLAAQEARIAAYGVAMGFDVSEVVRDAGESAKSLKRPGIASILASIAKGEVERLVVAKLDRLTRNVRDLADLIELCARHGVALVSVGETLDTSTAAGRMVINMLGTVAAWEREAIAERTASSLAHKRRAGHVYGPVPFGYRREGKRLIVEPREHRALREAMRMDRAGASFREIAAYLGESGVKPHRSTVWYASSVRAMLRSRMLTEAADLAA